MTWVTNQSVVLQALLGGLFTWFCTIVGSAVVFFFKTVSRRLLDTMLGFAAGVMIAASFWSLLAPSIEYAESSYGNLAWIPAAVGFAAGGIFLRLVDAWVPHLHLGNDKDKAEGGGEKDRKNLSKTALLFLAITIHNIPEGLAVGVIFGALASNYSPAAFIGAIGLAIGIGIQNIPEGAALAIPIRTDGASRWKAFYWGSMSAIVEPIAAVIGAFAGHFYDTYFTLCPLLCGRGHDFCRRRRAHSRIADKRQYGYCNSGLNGWFYHHDDFRCCSRIIC